MNNAAVVSLLRGLADLDDQIQALRRRQAVSGGILEQRLAMDSLHGEERSSTRDSGFENLRDAGMLETPERMRFLREAAENFRNSQAGLHHFEGDDSARTLLFGFVHNAHSTLADETDDAIGAEINGWARLGTPVRNLFEKSRSGDVLIEEGLDFTAQFMVALGSASDEPGSGCRILLTSLLIQRHNLFPALGDHSGQQL